MDFISQFKAARIASVPLVGVNTPDPAATIEEIAKLYEDKSTTALFVWDIVRGIVGYNKVAKDVMASVSQKPEMLRNPVDALVTALALPENSILFAFMPARYLDEPPISQAIWNLRDKFKGESHRTLIMLAPSFKLPATLVNDVLVLDEPLPTEDQLEEIIVKAYKAAGVDEPKKEDVERGVDATIGLPAFPAEQSAFMSAREDGLDFDYLQERKRQVIGQSRSLSVWRGPERFSSIGGCRNIKDFLGSILRDYRLIVFVDEIEKAVGGSGANGLTDSSTVENIGELLSEMQDRQYDGILELGVPGGAKSVIAKAAANEAGIMNVVFKLSAVKQSLLGQTGENLRNDLKTIYSLSQGRALFLATCNKIEALSAELRRRFNLGTFFFDYPDAEEREAIWPIHLKKYEILPKNQPRPRDDKWTGAEIENCCKIARKTGKTLVEAAKYVVPVSVSAARQIDELRKEADGRFISASYSGLFRLEGEQKESTSRRKLATV